MCSSQMNGAQAIGLVLSGTPSGEIGSTDIDSTQDSPDEAPKSGPPLEDHRFQLCFRENDLQ